jgi:hypothetical protein
MDTAFLRRLRFIVNFPFPGPAERLAIWSKVFPPHTPKGELDLPRLARLNLTGGSIHNIALNAAFLAAQAGTPVTMRLILDAARTEFCKLERPINEADFRLLESAGGRHEDHRPYRTAHRRRGCRRAAACVLCRPRWTRLHRLLSDGRLPAAFLNTGSYPSLNSGSGESAVAADVGEQVALAVHALGGGHERTLVRQTDVVVARQSRGGRSYAAMRLRHALAAPRCHAVAPARVQHKLTIGASALELEADRIADQVLSAPGILTSPALCRATHASQTTCTRRPRPHRQCASDACDAWQSARPCFAAGHGPLRSLLCSPRAASPAEQSARDVSANAYPVGHDLVFAAGQFAPGTLKAGV